MRPRRLYLRLYLAFLGVLLAVVLVVGVIGFLTGRPFLVAGRGGPRFAGHLARMLPPPSDPVTLQRAVTDVYEELGLDAVVLGPGGETLAAAGNPIPPLDFETLDRVRRGQTWVAPRIAAAAGRGGEVLVMRFPLAEGAGRRAAIRGMLWVLGALAVSLALVYPLSKSITRPLEQLTAVVEAYGRGEFTRRSGLGNLRDEVGRLARTFDEMADRIQAARKAEKELLANVSHELRTPLARIKVAMELVDARDETLLKRLASISEEVDELDRMVADVLTASRLDLASQPLRKVPLEAAAVVEKARQRALALDPDLRIAASVEPGLRIQADEALLSRALDNLLDNARKYGSRSPVEIEARQGDGSAVFAVRDRGPGISTEDLPRVFDPFFRGEGAPGRPGFGLGLALARRVAEAHGGSARALNAEGGGARIELRLPSRAPEEGAALEG